MTELRRRMIRDMTVRGFSPNMHESYIGAVRGLARHYRRSPAQLSAEEVQAYLAHINNRQPPQTHAAASQKPPRGVESPRANQ